jgi:hypothetical protein
MPFIVGSSSVETVQYNDDEYDVFFDFDYPETDEGWPGSITVTKVTWAGLSNDLRKHLDDSVLDDLYEIAWQQFKEFLE